MRERIQTRIKYIEARLEAIKMEIYSFEHFHNYNPAPKTMKHIENIKLEKSTLEFELGGLKIYAKEQSIQSEGS